MQQINPYYCEIRANPLSYEDFYQNVIQKNIVCLLVEQFTKEWTCRRLWVKNGIPDLEYLRHKYGESCALCPDHILTIKVVISSGVHTCPVYNCNKSYFDSNPKEPMLFQKYLDYWAERITNGSNFNESDILYLKDWHFFQDTLDEHVYEVLEYFESDYLNEYCLDNSITDYRFVYMGVKSSRYLKFI